MITEYFVCYGGSAPDLQKNVNAAIKNGWQPLGGLAVGPPKWECQILVNLPFFQAVVRVNQTEQESKQNS